MKVAQFLINGFITEGEVYKENTKTTIVKFNRAGKTKYVKRHNEKHHVEIIYEED